MSPFESIPLVTQLHLDRFDELEAIPLNENLPQPVIDDLPIPAALTPETQQGSLDLETITEKPKSQRRKKS